MSNVVGKRKSRLSLNSNKNSTSDEDGQVRIFSFFPKMPSREVLRQRSPTIQQPEESNNTPKNDQRKKKRSHKRDYEKTKENDNHKNQTVETARNAFIIMMDNRKKSIGQNPTGKELEKTVESIETHDENRRKLVARKSMLQEWADKKGATKRKIEDEEKGITIKHKLKRRAERFEQMLTKGETVYNDRQPVRQKTLSNWKMRLKVNLSDNEIDKLAPLHVKTPETKVVGRDFLESGAPDKLKRKMEAKDRLEVPDYQLFPKQTHVKARYNWNLDAVNINFMDPCLYNSKVGILSLGSITNLEAQDEVSTCYLAHTLDRVSNASCKKIVKQLKAENPDYPVKKVFKSLLRKSEDRVQFRMWTDLYRPCTSKEMLGNKRSLDEFKAWLKSRKYKRVGSDFEFESVDDDDNDSRNSSRLRRNAVIFFGPHGSGKTNAVYALCDELEINVLELNASSKRTGKRLLSELQEATQSHRLNKTQTFLKKHEQSDSANEISLILVEDVDVVFNQDENFINALSQLLLTSKRPVVLTTTDANCLHLKKFFEYYPTVTFNKYSSKVLSVWLQIVCLLEGSLIDKCLIDELLDRNKGDVRRVLLWLQFVVQTGGIRTLNVDRKSTPLSTGRIWWGLADSLNIPRPLKCDATDHRKIQKFENITNVLEALAVIDVAYQRFDLHSSLEPVYESSCNVLKDSLELTESNEEYDLNKSLICDWSRSLLEGYMGTSSYYCAVEEKRWRNKQVKCRNWFSQIVSNGFHLDHTSVDVDYLTTLRTIVRAEDKRFTFNNKRGNRFFNYLSSLGVTYNDDHFKTMCDTFSHSF